MTLNDVTILPRQAEARGGLWVVGNGNGRVIEIVPNGNDDAIRMRKFAVCGAASGERRWRRSS